MPQPTKNAAKRRPAATRRSPVIKAGKAQPAAHTGAEDDVKITALKLPPGELSPEMDAYFKKCDEKLGFVPNVLKAFAFDDASCRRSSTTARSWCKTPPVFPSSKSR